MKYILDFTVSVAALFLMSHPVNASEIRKGEAIEGTVKITEETIDAFIKKGIINMDDAVEKNNYNKQKRLSEEAFIRAQDQLNLENKIKDLDNRISKYNEAISDKNLTIVERTEITSPIIQPYLRSQTVFVRLSNDDECKVSLRGLGANNRERQFRNKKRPYLSIYANNTSYLMTVSCLDSGKRVLYMKKESDGVFDSLWPGVNNGDITYHIKTVK